MNEKLIAWDFVPEFTGQEAALAIIGYAPSNDAAMLANAQPVLDLMHRAYEDARKWFAGWSDDTALAPTGMLLSVEMLAQKGRIDPELELIGFGDYTFRVWLRSREANFEQQRFAPTVIAKWLQEINCPSVYSFASHPYLAECAKDMPAAQENKQDLPHSAEGKAQPVVDETASDKGFGAAPINRIKRGALIRKYRREWDGAEKDLNEGSRNGLKDAKLGGGFYDEDKAITWAKERGKFNEGGPSIAALPGLVHRMK